MEGGGVEDDWECGANTMGHESERGETGVAEGEGQHGHDFVKNRTTESAGSGVRCFIFLHQPVQVTHDDGSRR